MASHAPFLPDSNQHPGRAFKHKTDFHCLRFSLNERSTVCGQQSLPRLHAANLAENAEKSADSRPQSPKRNAAECPIHYLTLQCAVCRMTAFFALRLHAAHFHVIFALGNTWQPDPFPSFSDEKIFIIALHYGLVSQTFHES